MGDDDEVKPLGEVLAEFNAEGLAVDLDVLQRLRSEKIARMRGPTVTKYEARRLRAVLLIRKNLGGRFSYEKLAFYMAMHGMKEAPTSLVAQHMEHLVSDYIAVSDRMAKRQGTGRAIARHSQRKLEERTAVLITRNFLRAMHLPASAETKLAQDQLEAVLSFVVAVLWCNKTVAAASPYLRRAMFMSFPDESVAEQQFSAWQAFAERNLPSLSISNRTNALMGTVRSAMKQKAVIRTAARDAALMIRAVVLAFDRVDNPQPVQGSEANAYAFERLWGSLPGLLAAMSIQFQRNPQSHRFLKKLRSGDDFGLKDHVARFYSESLAQVEKARSV